MINVVVCGAAGRMGKENISVFSADSDVKIIGAIEVKNSKFMGKDAGTVAGIDNIGINITSNIENLIQDSTVVVDFTNPEATLENIKIVKKYSKAIVIGTTGFSENQISLLKEYSKSIPVVLSPNMSQGVNVLFYLVSKATELLGEQFEVEITEIHHNRKIDAPSGTALQFGNIIAHTRGTNLEEVGVFGRYGLSGERKKEQIGITALRLSDVIGDHSVIFGGPGERIEFIHKSSSRKTYASGALRAAKFVAQKKNGFFSINDVLGISIK